MRMSVDGESIKNASSICRLDLERVTAYQTDEDEEMQESEISPIPLTPFE